MPIPTRRCYNRHMKRVVVPKLFQELHGEFTTVPELAFTYVGALVITTALAIFDRHFFLTRHVGEMVVLSFVALDLSGGVIALRTPGTSEYYFRRPKHAWVFLAIHVVQPALLLIPAPSFWVYLVFLAAYTLPASALVMLLRRRLPEDVALRVAPSAALLLVSVGGIIATAGYHVPGYLAALGIIYMIKLIYAFAASPGVASPPQRAA